jgi:hypothetical protein
LKTRGGSLSSEGANAAFQATRKTIRSKKTRVILRRKTPQAHFKGHQGAAAAEAAVTAAVAIAVADLEEADRLKSSQINTLPKAKSETRSKQNKDMHKFSSVYSERGVPIPVLTPGGE